MTTGATLYLVSACASAEEFVAAFRRYADRTGLFVPISDPLPQGKRGRIAITLADGRIVLEGEAEVVTSATRPSPLYGRVGMTVKFVDSDAATKTTLTELEKARLALKPPPLSIAPREGSLPAGPRPTPPPVGGRIDAANAKAESIAIGDQDSWRDGAVPGKTGDSPSSKFVIPVIPPSRPKPASIPPALQPKSGPVVGKATTMGMPAIGRLPSDQAPEVEIAVPSTITKQGITPPTPPRGTMALPIVVRPPAPAVEAPARRDPTPLPKKNETVTIPKRDPTPVPKQTTLGMPVVRVPADQEPTTPAPIIEPLPTGSGLAKRAHTPSAPPPVPRNPTPYTPLPIVKRPASETLPQQLDLSEPTERTTIPEPPPVGPEQRKTSLGVQMFTAEKAELVDDGKSTEQHEAVVPPPDTQELAVPATPGRSGGLRASEIMAAMKGEDWTMTPDAPAPTPLPKSPDDKAAEEKSGPQDDFVISLDPAAPGGWSAPSKVEKLPDPPPRKHPETGNRNIAVASAKAIDAIEWEEKPTGIGEALVEIDPSLMGAPARPGSQAGAVSRAASEAGEAFIVSTPAVDIAPPPVRPTPVPFAAPPRIPPPLAPPAKPPTAAEASSPAWQMSDHTDTVRPAKKKPTVIYAIVGLAVLAVAAVAIVVLTKGKKPAADDGSGSGSSGSGLAIQAPPPIVVDAAAAAVAVEPPPKTDPTPPPPPPPAKTTCKVDVSTIPAGAELSIADAVVGTSPATLELPCGAESTITAKKAKWGQAQRAVTPKADMKLAIKIAAPMFSVKVTSSPPGATVMINNKPAGITPTTVKVPLGGASITLSKDGFVASTQKVAPKANNTAVSVTLQKKQRLR